MHRRCAAALVAALAAAPGLGAQETAGYVSSVQGTWFTSARPRQPVSAGRVVAAGEEVWAAPRSPAAAYLNVVLRDGNRFTLSCSVDGDCDRRHTLQLRRGLLEDAGRIVDAVLDLVRRDPGRLVPLISMGDPPGPPDLVVSPTGASLDLAPVLAQAPPGRYVVELVHWRLVAGSHTGVAQANAEHSEHAQAASGHPTQAQVAQGAQGQAAVQEQAWQMLSGRVDHARQQGQAQGGHFGMRIWTSGQSLVHPGVPPGLYVVRAFNLDTIRPSDSWVLVAPPEERARMEAEVARAKAIVQSWVGIQSEHDARLFLRAYMLALTEAPPVPAPR